MGRTLSKVCLEGVEILVVSFVAAGLREARVRGALVTRPEPELAQVLTLARRMSRPSCFFVANDSGIVYLRASSGRLSEAVDVDVESSAIT